MKNLKFFKLLFVAFMCMMVVTTCKKDDKKEEKKVIVPSSKTVDVPSSMTVDVPSSISSQQTKKSAKDITELKGNDIYEALRGFVWIGAAGSWVMRDLLNIVKTLSINNISNITFTSKDDNLQKNLAITENGTFNGVTYQYAMIIKDFDGSIALELFWNNTPVVTGVAIYNSYKLNHNDIWANIHKKAMVQIEYSEAIQNYSAQMIVSIAGLTLIHTNDASAIKMFVGKRKTDGTLDIWGNSNSPNALIVDNTHTGGYEWAFVAHSEPNLDISVAQVSLPPCNYAKSDTTLWGTYSLYNVLYGELKKIGAGSTQITDFLKEATAPGYFVKGTGFIGCGPIRPTVPSGFTASFCDLTGLFPYVPNDINNLTLTFTKK